MSESAAHAVLVNSIVTWMNRQVSGDMRAVIRVDAREEAGEDRPPLIYGYYPDVYCETSHTAATYVGEAKITRDLETRRSKEQIAAYLRFLATRQRGTLVIAVPWHAVPRARAVVRALQRSCCVENVSTVFLEKLPG